jgi:hypothetical protein
MGINRRDLQHSRRCEERDQLRTEVSKLLADWLACLDELKQTAKNHPSHARQVAEAKEAKQKLKAAEENLGSHLRDYGCWRPAQV